MHHLIENDEDGSGPLHIKELDGAFLVLCEDKEEECIWGEAMCTGAHNNPTVHFIVPFEHLVHHHSFQNQFKLHSLHLHIVLGSDIEFLHTVKGLQTRLASFPCMYCLTRKNMIVVALCI